MNVIKTEIPGLLIFEPKIFGDARGFFMELYQANLYATYGVDPRFVQDNLSRSVKHTLRGLHFQNPGPQGKLVSVLRGSIRDVTVDVRVGSPNFGRHVTVELSEENRRQVWIPRGLAHGFIATSETADLYYKCDALYNPASEFVLRWDDPQLDIDWGCDAPLLSARDARGRSLAELGSVLPRFESD